MKVLHICNDYSYSKVYKNLYQELDALGIEQSVYHPLRSIDNKGVNQFQFKVPESQLIYSSFLLKTYHRVFFRLKISSLYHDIEKQIDFTTIDISYPTTLFSDGAIAYRLFKEYNIPYIVAVRNTDVNLFMKYRPDLIPLMHRILDNASKIIFISKGLKKLFYSKLKKNSNQYQAKTAVITNGIDKIWLKNIRQKNDNKGENNFLFVGAFNTNKNVINVINALKKLKERYPNIRLNLVGGGGNRDSLAKELIQQNKEWIDYLGYIKDKKKLLDIYRSNNYFIMPSIHETFGLVYIEALSQGLPILYTKNQGVDGLFDESVGIGTLPDEKSIEESIEKMINTHSFTMEEINFQQFNWENIAKEYEGIFQSVKK